MASSVASRGSDSVFVRDPSRSGSFLMELKPAKLKKSSKEKQRHVEWNPASSVYVASYVASYKRRTFKTVSELLISWPICIYVSDSQ